MSARWCWPLLFALLLSWIPPGAGAADDAAPAGPSAPSPTVPPEFQQLMQGAEVWNKLSPEARQALIAQFRVYLPQIQENVEKSMVDQFRAKHADAWEPINDLIIALICAGPLLLLTPLFVARRYPGKLRTLFLYSGLSAFMFSATVCLFYVPLWALSEVWEELALGVDPRLRTVHAAFELMDRNAEDFLSRDLPLAATLDQLDDGSMESFVTLLLANLAEVKEQAELFMPVVDMYRKLDWVFGSLPKVQCLVFTVLFVWPLVPVFKAIVLLPVHAAAGEEKEGRRVARLAMRNWWREVCALLALVALCIGIFIGNDVVLSWIADPATETMLNFLFVALDYLGHVETPSAVLLYFSLTAVAFFYLFIIVVMTAGLILYLRLAHRIFRLKFHERVPLKSHLRFWGWGTAAMIWVQALPLLFIVLAWPSIQGIFWAYATADPPDYLGSLVTGGALLFFGILFVFWLFRGFKALMFLVRYSVPMAKVATE